MADRVEHVLFLDLEEFQVVGRDLDPRQAAG
jgi:hypothetical protein